MFITFLFFLNIYKNRAFNTVTFMTDHKLGRTADTRMTSAWFGGNAKRKVDALNLAVEMAKAA